MLRFASGRICCETLCPPQHNSSLCCTKSEQKRPTCVFSNQLSIRYKVGLWKYVHPISSSTVFTRTKNRRAEYDGNHLEGVPALSIFGPAGRLPSAPWYLEMAGRFPGWRANSIGCTLAQAAGGFAAQPPIGAEGQHCLDSPSPLLNATCLWFGLILVSLGRFLVQS